LRPDTYDKAQKIAAQLRVSVFDLEREWNEWAAEKGATINSPDGAFIGFCKSKLGSKAGNSVGEVRQLGLLLPELNAK
jgi:hypothetical protein